MNLKILASSLICALIVLVPLSYKWQIKAKISLASGIVIGLVTGFLVNWVNHSLDNPNLIVLLCLELFFIIIITLLVIILRFYRNPERVPLKDEKVILSPADGRVRYVKRIENGEIPFSLKGKEKFKLTELTKIDILNDGAYLVGIEMSVLDVHVNRAPIEGKIIVQKPTRGRFLSLKKIEALFCNERVTTIIDNGRFKVGVVQIASRLVRRIVSYLNEGDSVQIGQRIGMIKFGSQVDLVIPKLANIEINVKPGDRVMAGLSVIAEYS